MHANLNKRIDAGIATAIKREKDTILSYKTVLKKRKRCSLLKTSNTTSEVRLLPEERLAIAAHSNRENS